MNTAIRKAGSFEEILEKNGELIYTSVGVSMMPLIRQEKDLLVLTKKESSPKKEDVVFYKRPNGTYVLHRVIKVMGKGRYLIQGDNSPVTEIVLENQILGILSEIRRDKRRISVTDPEYLSYVKTLPGKRFSMRFQNMGFRIKRKIKKIQMTLFGRK